MAMDRQTRLLTLLAIDTVFFFLEIIVGYAVGSLALVADSFHMLNDVISFLVALWALKLSKNQDNSDTADPRFSYGWQRAEVLGALVNGVFLLALCFSIFLEATQRFFSVSEVQNPRLVIVVGTLGLLSNIVGLLLFHDHGHAHGGHSHGPSDSHSHDQDDDHSHSHSHSHSNPLTPTLDQHAHQHHHHHHHHQQGEGDSTSSSTSTAADPYHTSTKKPGKSHARGTSLDRDSLYGHPAQTRANVLQAAASLRESSRTRPEGGGIHIEGGERDLLPEDTSDVEVRALDHHGHGHNADGSMNMRGVFLHVLGDALGNVGVIASGLFILLSDKWWRFYTDPAISFLLTMIIFHSALPLVKSASYILLQGVPTNVRLDQVKDTLYRISGVLNVHDLHIWQLSESKSVASVHLLVNCSAGQIERYHTIAAQVKQVLHNAGVHSSTIQPEFVAGVQAAAEMGGLEVAPGVTDDQGRLVTRDGTTVEEAIFSHDYGCMLVCNQGGECNQEGCCSIRPLVRTPSSSESPVQTQGTENAPVVDGSKGGATRKSPEFPSPSHKGSGHAGHDHGHGHDHA